LAGFPVEGENEFTRDPRCGQSQNFGACLQSRKVDCCQRVGAKNICKGEVAKRDREASPKIFHKPTTGNAKIQTAFDVWIDAVTRRR
jgi:hypothetical protein